MGSSGWPRILAEQLVPLAEPLEALVRPGARAPARAVARRAAAELLELSGTASWDAPPWLAEHQRPAAQRLAAILARHGGAVLADAAGLGKSYVALAVAETVPAPLLLVVPAVLVPQWRDLLARLDRRARLVSHESLSRRAPSPGPLHPAPFVVVDEAHRFRNSATRRYQTLARMVVGSPLLLVTATPLHNRPADLVRLLRLFLADDALTGLGVPSLARAARGQSDLRALELVAPRLVVARSRAAVRGGYGRPAAALVFPARAGGRTVRAATAPAPAFEALVEGLCTLSGDAAVLVRVTLLRRLASSLPALRATLARHEALLRLVRAATREGRVLAPGDFARLFPRRLESDLQLILLPLLLQPGAAPERAGDPDAVAALRALAAPAPDPKAATLAALLAADPRKTIVFTDAHATVRHLLRCLGPAVRAAAVLGRGGRLGTGPATRAEVLRVFAPRAQRARPPTAALDADVLLATDLLSEGLDLQDAARVVHYDLPWSPARLAQRVGRIDRLGSPHARIDSVTFLPAEPLARALGIESRLAAKARAQARAGAAQVEGPAGVAPGGGGLDWCDRLHALLRGPGAIAPAGAWSAAAGERDEVVLVVRIGTAPEAFVVRAGAAASDPVAAARLLGRLATAPERSAGDDVVRDAIRQLAPLLRARLAAVESARWRAADRHGRARRLIPWVLAAARRAARQRDVARLSALDALLSRLAAGMTAGEELLLDDLLSRHAPLAIDDLLEWTAALPQPPSPPRSLEPELLAAVVFVREPTDP